MKASKKGFIYQAKSNHTWWNSHLMAPAPIRLDDSTIRIYVGAWDSNGISRIAYIDTDVHDPSVIKGISDKPVLDIGKDGCFDDNGVFPAHVYNFGDGRVWLFYTGFQKLDKIAFTNFTGLAVSNDNGTVFSRYSEAPTLDRADEGLYTRAGQSIYPAEGGGFHCVYSAGSGWHFVGGKKRPVYEVFYQKSSNGIDLQRAGKKIVECNMDIEHGLGRPQIIRLGAFYYVFYTRRIISDMKYFLGCARTSDFSSWERCDHIFDGVKHGEDGAFDSEMIYFPGVLQIDAHRAFCFYTGNHYGEDGLGYMELNF